MKKTFTLISDGTGERTRLIETDFFELEDLQIYATGESGVEGSVKLLKIKQNSTYLPNEGAGVAQYDANDYIGFMASVPLKVKSMRIEFEVDLDEWKRNHQQAIIDAKAVNLSCQWPPFNAPDIEEQINQNLRAAAQEAFKIALKEREAIEIEEASGRAAKQDAHKARLEAFERKSHFLGKDKGVFTYGDRIQEASFLAGGTQSITPSQEGKTLQQAMVDSAKERLFKAQRLLEILESQAKEQGSSSCCEEGHCDPQGLG